MIPQHCLAGGAGIALLGEGTGTPRTRITCWARYLEPMTDRHSPSPTRITCWATDDTVSLPPP
eukprot:scaffold16171_cov101-Isochrysis_galbana.AAC.1